MIFLSALFPIAFLIVLFWPRNDVLDGTFSDFLEALKRATRS